MLSALKFVQGAIARKDLIPEMTHFRIKKGFVRAYNGVIAICSPIEVDLDCMPRADTLVRAINMCNETITLSLTPAGKLRLASGSFRAYVDCIDSEIPPLEPEGELVEFAGEQILRCFKVLNGFVGDDASRPWTNGILLRNESAYATNNVIVAEYWLGQTVPFVANIPHVAIREVLRINEAPCRLQLTRSSMTFHYADGRWVRTQLLAAEWPDLSPILNKDCAPIAINPKLFDGLDALKSFSDELGRVYIKDGVLRTQLDDGAGATYEIAELAIEGAYQISMLSLLREHATTADFTLYPLPCLFFGERLRGALVGLRS